MMVKSIIIGNQYKMWSDKLKEANVNIHVIATGAGAGLQNDLWSIPGSSAYLSGCSFPYAPEETTELLGFTPKQFVSEDTAIDLASAAYMKAYKFGGKSPVGVGLTASVASEREHRGDHRVFACVITNDKVLLFNKLIAKGIGEAIDKRKSDGGSCDGLGFYMILDALDLLSLSSDIAAAIRTYKDGTALAKERFFAHPFFSSNGKRLEKPELINTALMSGSFNPPHEGHFGAAKSLSIRDRADVVFEITAEPPHKNALTIQDLLKRAKGLQGYDRLFTSDLPYYLDKAKAFPGTPFVVGADTLIRLFDPKWGKSIQELVDGFCSYGTVFYTIGRQIDGKFITAEDIIQILNDKVDSENCNNLYFLIKDLPGRWDTSSTELRNKLL